MTGPVTKAIAAVRSEGGSAHASRPTSDDAIFDMEGEVRATRYLGDAIAALAQDKTSDRDAISFLAFELQRHARRLESTWERAFAGIPRH